MLVTFRIKDTSTPLHSKPAEITPRELAGLMRRLHANDTQLDTDPGELEAAPISFEVNANSLSMAAFVSCFGDRPDIIAIVEEAQFLSRTVRIEKSSKVAPITMKVSEHIALARHLMMGPDLAAKVLYALGRDSAEPGELTLENLRQVLRDNRTYDAFCAAKIAPVFDSLTFLAFTDCGEQAPVMEWSQ